MKELEPHDFLFKEKTKTESTQESEQEYQLLYQGTIIPYEGHTLYEIDVNTLEITEAKYELRTIKFDPNWKKGDKIPSHSEVIMQEGKAYVSALNKNNALKKFKKGCNGTKINPNKIYLNL